VYLMEIGGLSREQLEEVVLQSSKKVEKVQNTSLRQRAIFILLGLFLGSLGIHNFYAGYYGRGVSQLVLFLGTCGYGLLITVPWNVIELCVVVTDAEGKRLA